MSSFTAVPVLDFSLSRDESAKPAFLDELRRTLLEVGFLYIKNTGIDEDLVEEVIRLGKAFFDLPESEKMRLEMKNSPHFLGYSRLGNEITKHATDWREQIDLATELSAPSPSEPRYRMLRGPNHWPKEELLPGFRKAFTEYMNQMTELSTNFTSLVAEAIGLPANSFEKYFDASEDSASGTKRQDKLKIVKYPDLGELGEQVVGSQGDSMLSSYLLQATDHKGLQVQNYKGDWIDCVPIKGTFVVAMGQGLEAMTGGVCVSTTHRVISPPAGSGPRFSIPFFQGVSYDATFESMDVPEEVKALKQEIMRKEGGQKDEVETTFKKGGRFKHLGEATLMNRVKSHPDVGGKYYPDLLKIVREQEKVDKEQSVDKPGSENSLSVPTTTVTTADGTTDDAPATTQIKGRRRAPTIVVELTPSDQPSYGEDPGPDGSIERKEAYEMRKADAVPDVVRVIER
ncbi:Clavaminate synthase-like protein [Choiromyces venosus 120613-1]|uniref:Clavaminate synthase-like protein n=1 Tax=Choiromyces venosus 120613-1 TaxID=1336337 RepID=A0A3N4K7H2_9PEZI|nr:Clavaminate synthase-like protein [Choiromyces venosus 120613-1]